MVRLVASALAVVLVAGCTSAAPAPTPTTAAAPKPTPPLAVASPVASPATAASPAVAVSPAAAPGSGASPAPSPAGPAIAKPVASPAASPFPSVIPSPAAAAAAPVSLKGVCPDTVVFQTNWWPEPDQGLLYQLIAPNGTIDTNRNTYSGALGQTGVNVEIRAGGPAVGFQNATAQLYQDDTILLGMVSTDEQVGASASQPTKAVLAWYVKNPLILFWGNPDWNFTSAADIGNAGATVLAFSGAAYLDVLQHRGDLHKDQIDTSYSGDPSRFVAADGNIVSQGFVTGEPYIYEHEVNGWKKPVKFLLLDKEVPNYQNTLAIRADKLDANRACLQRLVPLLQKASIDYLKNPGPVNAVLTDFTSRIRGGTQITAAAAADAVQKMTSLGIVGNGPDGVFGAYDLNAVQTMIDDYGPVYAARGKAPKPNLSPADLVSNEFVDKSIKL